MRGILDLYHVRMICLLVPLAKNVQHFDFVVELWRRFHAAESTFAHPLLGFSTTLWFDFAVIRAIQSVKMRSKDIIAPLNCIQEQK